MLEGLMKTTDDFSHNSQYVILYPDIKETHSYETMVNIYQMSSLPKIKWSFDVFGDTDNMENMMQ
jgi:hypothetical protein